MTMVVEQAARSKLHEKFLAIVSSTINWVDLEGFVAFSFRLFVARVDKYRGLSSLILVYLMTAVAT
jgi:hypothetical protein